MKEGKIEEGIEVKGIQGKRRDLKEKRRYWKLKEEALDRTLWRTCLSRSFVSVVRQTTALSEPVGVELIMRGCVPVIMVKTDFWNFICRWHNISMKAG